MMYQSPENRNSLQSITHLTSERSPLVVAAQTSDLLEQLSYGDVRLGPAREYLHEFTIPYLESAAQSSSILFDDDALRSEEFDPDSEMAARHAYVVMAWMSEIVKSPQLPMGFSRQGMLRAPSTKRDFIWRISELEEVLDLISTVHNALRTPDKNQSKIRTINYFGTAGSLKLHLPPTQRESAETERQNLENLLAEVNINL